MKALIGLLLALCASVAMAVDANTANEAELDSVKGLGPASTARILTARTNGSFADWADLMRRVRGIKPATARKLSQAGLTVNNAPYEAGPAATAVQASATASWSAAPSAPGKAP